MYEFSIQYANQRADDFQREAEQHLLIRQALEARGNRERFYAPFLAYTGRRLVDLGAQLQQRYAESSSETRVAVQTEQA